MMLNKAYLALGTNIGDRSNFLKEALRRIDQMDEITITEASSIYETEPVGYVEQDAFLNMVVEVETSFTAIQLLDAALAIEAALGRKREIKWGPRTIDLDILLFNQENIETERLMVPHPRMHERGFVLLPLYEINPNVKIPGQTLTLSDLIERLEDRDREGVRLWKQRNGAGEYGLFAN